MTVQTFRELLTRRPFRPFRLVMASGHSYDVRHPETAFLTINDLLVGVDLAEDGVPEAFRICPILQISSVEPLDAAPDGPS